MEINKVLKKYIENEVLPTYEKFDYAHDARHVNSVIARALQIAEYLNQNLNFDIVYAASAYHDIGMLRQRKGHVDYSYEIVLNDENLKKFFTEEEILIIAEACQDHSTSAKRLPRSIYGKIVSDADKDTDMDIALMRGWDYSIFNFPELSVDEHVLGIHNQIVKRFGENGSVRFYTGYPLAESFLKQMRQYAEDLELFKSKMHELLIQNESCNNK